FFYAAFGLFALAGGRRGVAVGTGVWLAAVAGAYLKNRWRDVPMLPGWGQIVLSGYNLPFLAGAAVYHVRDRAAALRPWVLLALPALLLAPYLAARPGAVMLAQSAACAAVVWLVAGGPDWRPDGLAVRLGDASYGLYLIHFPVLGLFLALNHVYQWFPVCNALVLFAAAVAVVAGVAYGTLEWSAYRRLRGRIVAPRRGGRGLTRRPPGRRAA